MMLVCVPLLYSDPVLLCVESCGDIQSIFLVGVILLVAGINTCACILL